MKNRLELSGLAFPGSIAVAILLTTGCPAQRSAQQAGRVSGPVYETAEQIKAMPRCRAKVMDESPCSVSLETADGKWFYLGSPGSNADVNRFLAVLKAGRSYYFPDAFVKYRENQQSAEP